jgi:hypothetical protein
MTDVNLDGIDSPEDFLGRGRSGYKFGLDEADQYNSTPFMLAVRPRVQESDLGWIFARLAEVSDARAGLYVGLLSKWVTTERVRTFLKSHWEIASPYVRSQLLWRMLDDPELSPEWHTTLFEFVLAEWEEFQTASRKFLGTAHELVLSRALERYADSAWPASKKWAYLCSALGASDYPGALKLVLRLGELSGDQFQAEVAARLHQKLVG